MALGDELLQLFHADLAAVDDAHDAAELQQHDAVGDRQTWLIL